MVGEKNEFKSIYKRENGTTIYLQFIYFNNQKKNLIVAFVIFNNNFIMKILIIVFYFIFSIFKDLISKSNKSMF